MARWKRSAEKERFWRSMVEQQGRGSLSVRAFCRQQELSEASFYAWRRELQKRDAAQGADAGHAAGAENVAVGPGGGRLIPVAVVGAGCEGEPASGDRPRKLPLEIGTPGGFTLRFDRDTRPETIAGLLEAIGRHRAGGGASC